MDLSQLRASVVQLFDGRTDRLHELLVFQTVGRRRTCRIDERRHFGFEGVNLFASFHGVTCERDVFVVQIVDLVLKLIDLSVQKRFVEILLVGGVARGGA